uniref:Uncharacterized protein n=2 Tax=Timema TaxID=61471 RepID=A0A7R9P247_9NEOP|nr:unnamed protein product [Timema bartmani]CAD7464596.1 unnamed protein product [Timema tahoe]
MECAIEQKAVAGQHSFDDWCQRVSERNAVRVLDIYGLFLQEDGTINLDLF